MDASFPLITFAGILFNSCINLLGTGGIGVRGIAFKAVGNNVRTNKRAAIYRYPRSESSQELIEPCSEGNVAARTRQIEARFDSTV